ncbi:alpha-(1,3)-fucosyltransferase C-like [Anticarsia gemmatalis]|uniref:alpha-(1,3)-fucosyltransferase C-like n=1 Tax=Anticarsia gemmatalis TaxID=129554 RepID=UPI003F7730E0
MMKTKRHLSDQTRYEIYKMKSMQTTKIKYILLWTAPDREPIEELANGTSVFEKRKCRYKNCFVTTNRDYLDDVTEFDVIIFHGPELNATTELPEFRSPHQKYVFASMESSGLFSNCNTRYNCFFNWSWTYKFRSTARFGYISIWDHKGTIIGPQYVMRWKKVEDMEPIDVALKKKLSTKKYAAAWFVSHCNTPSKRKEVAYTLNAELLKYGLNIDIYGKCGTKQCPRSKMSKCLEMLERDYYFYLSFENSFSEDYVTEKLLHALQHYSVPIVFGGANYSKFMPDGIYLNVRGTTMADLAKKMSELIDDKEKYYEYFKWHKYYSYHEPKDSSLSDPYCEFCALVNNKKRFDTPSYIMNFIHWWNPPFYCDRNFFKDITKFDVIVFHGPDLIKNISDLPSNRSPRQKYVFASMEPPGYYPVCHQKFNDYFNWTWTYKLNSDQEYGYISIWDHNCVIIGPKEIMHWKKVQDMKPIDDTLKKKLSTKRYAAAWFMPDGIYLNARKMSIRQLVKRMMDLMENKNKYYSYFKWHNHYSYHDVIDSPESDAYCKLCALINDEQQFKRTTVFNNFVPWWSPPNRCFNLRTK